MDADSDAAVVVSELVTNAIVHGSPPVTLHVVRNDDKIHIEVRDGNSQFGQHDNAALGLRLVEGFCLDWGVTHFEAGKFVWADLPA
jgi:anti-sigma regulatory factor (Ser/Thr protein kinase)